MVKKRNKSVSLLLAIALVLVVVSLLLSFSMSAKPLEVYEFDVSFSVSPEEKVGFDVNNSELIFGRTSPGGHGIIRFVNVDNQHPFVIEVKVLMSQNLLPVLEVNSSFLIEPDENFSLPIKLAVPEDFEFGNYTGKVKIKTYKIGDG
ncbi:MAG: hypothetical protein ABIH92_00490 [Nanoarchaeota archaeon]